MGIGSSLYNLALLLGIYRRSVDALLDIICLVYVLLYLMPTAISSQTLGVFSISSGEPRRLFGLKKINSVIEIYCSFSNSRFHYFPIPLRPVPIRTTPLYKRLSDIRLLQCVQIFQQVLKPCSKIPHFYLHQLMILSGNKYLIHI